MACLFFVLDHTQRYQAREYIGLPVRCCQVMWFWICTDTGSSWGSLHWLCGHPVVQSSGTIGWWCQVWQVRNHGGEGVVNMFLTQLKIPLALKGSFEFRKLYKVICNFDCSPLKILVKQLGVSILILRVGKSRWTSGLFCFFVFLIVVWKHILFFTHKEK